jgi:hypothetical protein
MTIKQKQLGGITELDKDGYGFINVNNSRIINAASPVDGYDLATKNYVDEHSGSGGDAELPFNTLTNQIIAGSGFIDVVEFAISDINDGYDGYVIRTFGIRASIYENPYISDFVFQEDLSIQVSWTVSGITLKDKVSGPVAGPDPSPVLIGTFDDSGVDWKISKSGSNFIFSLGRDISNNRNVSIEAWRGTKKIL